MNTNAKFERPEINWEMVEMIRTKPGLTQEGKPFDRVVAAKIVKGEYRLQYASIAKSGDAHTIGISSLNLEITILFFIVSGITIVLLGLSRLFRKLLRNDKSEKSSRNTKHIIQLAYQPDLDKDDRHAENNLKKAIHDMEITHVKSMGLKQIDKPLEEYINQNDVCDETTLIRNKK